MKRFLLLLAACSAALFGQIQTVPNSSTATVRSVINSNFSWISTNKAGNGSCGSGTFAIQTTVSGVVCVAIDWSAVANKPLLTGAGSRLVSAASVPADGCATFTSGNLGTSGAACVTGGWISMTLAGSVGQAACGYLGYSGRIQSAILAEVSVPPVTSSATVDVWIGGFQPTASNSIIGSGAKPALSSATSATPAITGWTPTFSSGQWVCGHVDAVSSARVLNLILVTARN